MIRRGGMAVVLWAFAVAPASGQEGSWWCVRGAPAPECRGILRIEARGGGAMGETVRYHQIEVRDSSGVSRTTEGTPWVDVGDWIGVELGYVVNVNERWGLGGSAAVETGNETTRVLLRARARRWMGARLYAEGLVGGMRQSRDLVHRSGDGVRTGFGATGEARIGYSGWGFALVRYDVLDLGPVEAPLGGGRTRVDPGTTTGALSLGGGLEGPAALVAGGLTLVVGTVLVLLGAGPGA